jgi:pimeloyl-ACP methyl ester carboxylesterase
MLQVDILRSTAAGRGAGLRWPGAMLLMSLIAIAIGITTGGASAQDAAWPEPTFYRRADVGGHSIFYREAGDPKKPTILLLHGYPASSHSYRELIPLLSGRYHVIAPDNLGSGFSDKPNPATTNYTFDMLAEHVDGLLRTLGVEHCIIYMQDFGAPVGFRVMMRNPGRIKAVIAQSANAYIEGIAEQRREFFRNAQLDKSPENVARLFALTERDRLKNTVYLRDVKGKEEIISPDAWTQDSYFLQSDSDRNIQVQLFQDYKTNLDSYSRWQEFLRQQQYPTLLVWGAKDSVFTVEGAKAYLKDVPKAELHLLDAGHFAVEEKPVEIARHIISFLMRNGLS